MIHYLSENIAVPDFNQDEATVWIMQVAAQHGKKVGNINYIFCDDEKILKVNYQYLHHDYYTDIITFDYSSGTQISGDIFISVDTVKSNADQLKISFMDELYRVIIHGILHLCGQDDKTPESEAEMRKKENKAMELLEKKG